MATDDGRVRVASALEATGAWEGPLDVDLGNLLVSDAAPLDPATFAADAGGPKSTAASLERGRDVLQRLVADLFSLPSESDVNGRFVQLPRGTTGFPRTKPLVVQEKPMTKWRSSPRRRASRSARGARTCLTSRRMSGGGATAKTAPATRTRSSSWTGSSRKKAGTSVVRPRTRSPWEEREKRERVEKNAGRQQKNLQQAVATHGAEHFAADAAVVGGAEKGRQRCRWGRWARNRSGT